MFWDNFSFLCTQKGTSPTAVISALNISRGSVTHWKTGKVPHHNTLIKIADYFSVSVDYLLGNTTPFTSIPTAPNADMLDETVYNVPVFESVSAGFGAYPDNHITGYIPMFFSSHTEAEESIFVIVRGDSMFPKIEDGDTVLVHKQASVDSGSLAVVLVDGEDALVKKIVYGETWIELQSINPMYPPMRFSGQDVLRVQVLGIVKKILKNV